MEGPYDQEIGHGLDEDVAFLLGEGRDIYICAAVKAVVAFDTLAPPGLQKPDAVTPA
jgi:hypothetical protein